MFNYDELYGVNLDEYCNFHNVEIEDLINKTKKDIFILKRNLNKLIYKDCIPITEPIIGSIYELIQKKEKHLKRLIKWKRSKNDSSSK